MHEYVQATRLHWPKFFTHLFYPATSVIWKRDLRLPAVLGAHKNLNLSYRVELLIITKCSLCRPTCKVLCTALLFSFIICGMDCMRTLILSLHQFIFIPSTCSMGIIHRCNMIYYQYFATTGGLKNISLFPVTCLPWIIILDYFFYLHYTKKKFLVTRPTYKEINVQFNFLSHRKKRRNECIQYIHVDVGY